MSLQLRSLIWKEWHERKWSLALGTAWIMLGVAYTVGYECAHRVHAPVASFLNTCMVYGLFAAVFLAMRTALGEVSQGTFSGAANVGIVPDHLIADADGVKANPFFVDLVPEH